MKTTLIKRAAAPAPLEDPWSNPVWHRAEVVPIAHCVGGDYDHQPITQARLLYDNEALYVAFRVEDQYVRAVAETWHGRVYRDSCVELFFTPGEDTSPGYFNVEINCGGVMLIHFQPAPAQDIRQMPIKLCERIDIWHSLPRTIDPELAEPIVWQVSYRLPLDILTHFLPVSPPKSGGRWKANFYKCADRTSHPHWLSWAPIDTPGPNFHRPDAFGELLFE
ncbi:MAG: carbohydrate-binding family 9-like protein [Planctomycetota bacterium]|jgi:hypothetical protein